MPFTSTPVKRGRKNRQPLSELDSVTPKKIFCSSFKKQNKIGPLNIRWLS